MIASIWINSCTLQDFEIDIEFLKMEDEMFSREKNSDVFFFRSDCFEAILSF